MEGKSLEPCRPSFIYSVMYYGVTVLHRKTEKGKTLNSCG